MPAAAAAPAPLQALASKSFLDWAAPHADKHLQALTQRCTLAAWVSADVKGEASPGGSAAGAPLPWIKAGKMPAWWWREGDTRALLHALHQLGWLTRKTEKRGQLLNAALTDPR